MKLSVALITYNHESFITQALEGALNQRTNFDYEIVVGEDCSTDRTRERIDAIAAQHPGKIRLVTSPKNVGMNRNLVRTLQACTGEYIALLEGDDFWTDPTKLQKQVDHLDANSECGLCFHEIKVRIEATGEETEATQEARPERYGLADLLASPCLMYTGAVVLRRKEGLQFPDWFFSLPAGDLPLYCLLLGNDHGRITHIPGVMGCYRIHPGGVWSQGAILNSQDGPARAATIRRHIGGIQVRETLNTHFGFRYTQAIRPLVGRWAWNLVWLFELDEDWSRMRKYWWKAIRACPSGVMEPRLILRSFVVAHFPKLYRALR